MVSIPNIALVPYEVHVSQNDIANHSGLDTRRRRLGAWGCSNLGLVIKWPYSYARCFLLLCKEALVISLER